MALRLAWRESTLATRPAKLVLACDQSQHPPSGVGLVASVGPLGDLPPPNSLMQLPSGSCLTAGWWRSAPLTPHGTAWHGMVTAAKPSIAYYEAATAWGAIRSPGR